MTTSRSTKIFALVLAYMLGGVVQMIEPGLHFAGAVFLGLLVIGFTLGEEYGAQR